MTRDESPSELYKAAEVGTDAISRKALINKLEQWQKQDGYDNGEWNLLVDVITEIKNMPLATDINVATKDGTDCISREQAIDAVNCVMVMKGIRSGKSITAEAVDCAKRIIADNILHLPPIQPKRGRWIYCEDSNADCVDGYRCDQCGFFVPWDYQHKSIDYIKDYNFCPNCGADMRGEQDG